MREVQLSGVERFFEKDNIIVSKTNLKGHLTYANQTFIKISGYVEKDLIGAPHSILRHPDMPRCVFKFMWDTIMSGQEIFAYVINRCANGDHYWVVAHVTPSYDENAEIVGYHSNRRVPDRDILDQTIIPLYQSLKAEEDKHSSRKDGMQAGYQKLIKALKDKDIGYDEFIFSL